MSGGNPIQYTSRTFLTALSDINSDPLLVDKPDWFKRLIAGAIDVASTWENATANNGYLRTVQTRRALTDLCALIDYNPLPQVSASGTEYFDIDPAAVLPYTISQANLGINGPSSFGSGALRYGPRSGLTFNSLVELFLPTAVNLSNGQITVAASPGGYVVGEKVRFSSTGTIPTGFSANTDYFVSSVNTTIYYVTLAATRAAAFLGTVIIPSTQGTGTISMTRLSRPITCYQETDASSQQIGTSDGYSQWQECTIAQVGVQTGTLVITINGVTWTQVTTLALSNSSAQVYRVYFNTDGTALIRFGNGTYGAIPPAASIFATYSYGGGAKSNVTALNQLTAYAGGDSKIKGCFNSTSFSSGSDAESFASAQNNAPMLLKSRSRFVTASDGEALALAQGGLSLVVVNPNVYGVLSSQVIGVASGGGAPPLALRTSIAAYLQSVSPLSEITVIFDPGTFTPFTVPLNVHILGGYVQANVLAYVKLAVLLFFSETGAQIVSAYQSGGVSAAVALINTIFSSGLAWALGASDYAVVTAILTTLVNLGTQTFGSTIAISDLYTVCSAIPGVAWIALNTNTSPALPYQCAAAEISTIPVNGSTIALVAV